jgi:hypothetical protein
MNSASEAKMKFSLISIFVFFLSACGSLSHSDLKSVDAASPVLNTRNNCRGVAQGVYAYCDTGDCRGVVTNNIGFCVNDDCRAIIWGNIGYCRTNDCKAVVFKNMGLCDSKNCEAVIFKNPGLCK